MKPNDIKENKWYKFKGNIFHPYFYARRIHKPKSVDKGINSYLVEGVHVSGLVAKLEFGIIKYIPAVKLMKCECLPNPSDQRADKK